MQPKFSEDETNSLVNPPPKKSFFLLIFKKNSNGCNFVNIYDFLDELILHELSILFIFLPTLNKTEQL